MKPWKVQKFFGDLVYDLRSRNLLLIVIMLIVALVAVPVLLSKSGSSSNSVSLSPGVQSAATAPEAQSAVLAYDPGVRNFKQRLRALSTKNPFAQQFASPSAAAANALDSSSTSTTSTGSGPSSGTTSGTGDNSGGGNSGGGKDKSGGSKVTTQTYVYQTDVLVGESGGPLTLASKIPQFTFLPSPDKPALVYLGTTSNGTQALFLVSKDVTSVGGEGTCFPTADDCQLLGLDPGKAADVLYGPDGKTYRVQVARIKRFTK